ncbi:MAG: extracellular solute-binding protein [Kiritimatiellae bacterium]|nr:extracellular solute-binding protein [Kiritimatiellia bacterium]
MRTLKPQDGVYILVLLLLLAVPFLLRPARETPGGRSARLVIVSPHNEAVQYEFERAFRRWHREKFHGDVVFDWRNIGGTSEIARYLDSSFLAAGRAGLAGIGIDLFFGGGQYDHALRAGKGHSVPCGLRERHPEWLNGEIIPSCFSGEVFYDPGDRWYGCCLSSFGICYNEDSLAYRGLSPPLQKWRDLADFRLFERVALADPTKSGSINKAFEMLIQEQISEQLAARGQTAGNAQISDLAEGWRRAFLLIRQIGANARYFTDSAGQVTVDVAQGNAAAGMCIDFYGRFESETVERSEASFRMKYVTPGGGSSVSVDPISLLRGAPNRVTAERFIDFCLSTEGQLLWNTRVGCPGGPTRYALRRLPIRRDLYAAPYLASMSDPAARPYQTAGRFEYRSGWTGPLFGVIKALIRSMCIDPHDELKRAWETINQAGGPAACPRAMAVFAALPEGAEYERALATTAAQLADKLEEARLMREWTVFFRNQYRRAAFLAKDESNPEGRRR